MSRAESAMGHFNWPRWDILIGPRQPGRLEQVTWNRMSILLDAAHNIDGMRSLLDYIETRGFPAERPQRIIFLGSFLETKDWRSMLELLVARLTLSVERSNAACLPGAEQGFLEFWFTQSAHTQAANPHTLASYCSNYLEAQGEFAIVRSFDSPIDAIRALSPSELVADGPQKQDVSVIIAGSIYLLGDIYPLLGLTEFATCK